MNNIFATVLSSQLNCIYLLSDDLEEELIMQTYQKVVTTVTCSSQSV